MIIFKYAFFCEDETSIFTGHRLRGEIMLLPVCTGFTVFQWINLIIPGLFNHSKGVQQFVTLSLLKKCA